MRQRAFAGLAAAALLTITACGGDDDDAAPSVAPSVTGAATVPAATGATTVPDATVATDTTPATGATTGATDDGGVAATYDGRPVLTARCSHDPVTDVEPVRAEEARAAAPSFAGLRSHPFPTCFSCGTGRAEGDGLRIFPGRVGDAIDEPGEGPRPRVAATWTPDASATVSAASIAAGVVPQSSWSLNPAAPPRSCSHSAS